jgi:hypothetical protein
LDGVALIDHLFNRLDGMYPHRWRSAFANQQAIANWREAWAETFIDEKITLNEAKAGLNECRRRLDWPPALPEFLKLCRPAFDFEVAYHEAMIQMQNRERGTDKWSHPAIFWTTVAIGVFDMRNSSWIAIKHRWSKILQAEFDKGEWPAVPDRRDALPAPGRTTLSREEAKKRLDELGAGSILKKSSTRNENGELLWAVRIFGRYAAGNYDSEYGLRCAEEALGRRRPDRARVTP